MAVGDVKECTCSHVYCACASCGSTSDNPKDFCPSCSSKEPYIEKYDSYIYYECSSCGATSDEPQDNCTECGCEYTYNMKYNSEYTVTLILDGSCSQLLDNQSFMSTFSVRSDEELAALYNTQFDGILSMRSLKTVCNSALIEFSFRRLTNEITRLTYIRNSTASTTRLQPSLRVSSGAKSTTIRST